MFQFELGKKQENEQTLINDACILASRAFDGNDENYNNMLNLVQGSQNGKVAIMFLKAYPDAYREDGVARKVIDKFIENNDSVYSIHAKALSLYSLEKNEFIKNNKTDLLNAISIKNKEYSLYKKCDEVANAYSNKFGDELEKIAESKTQEAHHHLELVKGIQEKLGEKGLAVESLLTEASAKYMQLADSQAPQSALISRAESCAIKHSIGKTQREEVVLVSFQLAKSKQATQTAEIVYASLMFDNETDNDKSHINYYQSKMANLFNDVPISKAGVECINTGAELIANFENQDAPVSE